MAKMCTFTHSEMGNQNGHIDRMHDDYSNPDIDASRTHLNYSFKMDHGGLTPTEYYHQRINEVYMYFRGTKREKECVTGCGWVITCPKEICGNKEKEDAFFKGVFDFIQNRYGKENILNNAIHYDEGVKNDAGEVFTGLPHLHVIIAAITTLDHNQVRYKTRKTKEAIRLPSGRYEMKYIHVDEKGKKIDENKPEKWVPVNNYKRMSDYYNEKVDANAVFNKEELRQFHQDLQKYLADNNIEGKVITGKTGTSFTVSQLKELTKITNLTIDQLEEYIPKDKTIFEALIDNHNQLEKIKDIIQVKDMQIAKLSDVSLVKENEMLNHKVQEMEKIINHQREEIDKANTRIKELEKDRDISVSDVDSHWGSNESSWGNYNHDSWGIKDINQTKDI